MRSMKSVLVLLDVLLVASDNALADDGDAPNKDADKFKITNLPPTRIMWLVR